MPGLMLCVVDLSDTHKYALCTWNVLLIHHHALEILIDAIADT